MKRRTVKRICSVLAALVAVLACALVFAACDHSDANTGEVTVGLIIGEAEAVSVTSDAPYLYDMLVEYCAEEGIALEGEESAYGFYITRIGDMVQGDGKYIMFYHDIDDVTLYTPGFDTERDGKTFFSSSLGVSSLPLRDGATYLIVLE